MKWYVFVIGCIVFAPWAFGLELTEIMYNPVGTDTGHEWVEFRTDEQINLSQIKFNDNEGNHLVSIVQGSGIAESGEYIIIANNASAFLLDYPGFAGSLLQSSFSLSNTGEQVGIVEFDTGIFLDAVSYTTALANGNGKTLEKRGDAWVESSLDGGTPGFGEQHEVPEFTAIAAGVAMCGAVAGFVFLRKK